MLKILFIIFFVTPVKPDLIGQNRLANNRHIKDLQKYHNFQTIRFEPSSLTFPCLLGMALVKRSYVTVDQKLMVLKICTETLMLKKLQLSARGELWTEHHRNALQ